METLLVVKEENPASYKETIRIFENTQCSWCRKFYQKEPFTCNWRYLKSYCSSIEKLNEKDRKNCLTDYKWWKQMDGKIKHELSTGQLRSTMK
jgi:hypothetical protein